MKEETLGTLLDRADVVIVDGYEIDELSYGSFIALLCCGEDQIAECPLHQVVVWDGENPSSIYDVEGNLHDLILQQIRLMPATAE